MIIKQIQDSYPKESLNIDGAYDDYVIGIFKKIMNDKADGCSTIIKYLFTEMPRKFVKIVLKRFDGEADPDQTLTLELLFGKLKTLIITSSSRAINTDNTSKLMQNYDGYMVPYFKEYGVIITTELDQMTNNFFNHLSGMKHLIDIFYKLN